MKSQHYKSKEENKYIFNLTFGMVTLAVMVFIFVWAIVGMRYVWHDLIELAQPKATYISYVCFQKKNKSVKRVQFIDGVIKNEDDITKLMTDIAIKDKCENVVIEPGWRTVLVSNSMLDKDVDK